MIGRQNHKDRHHHVWQQYLRAWTTDGALWCLRDGRIFQTGTPVVAVERSFYKLHNLTVDEIKIVQEFFSKGHEAAIQVNMELLNLLMAPFRLAAAIPNSSQSTALTQAIDEWTSNLLENYHMHIEASFIPLLKQAIKGDISFYDDDDLSITFFNFLSTQYMRTKGIKERSISLSQKSGSGPDLSRMWNVMIHMFATNIGAQLYVERSRRKMVILRNDTTVPFVTGDQPAINLYADGNAVPTKLSVYYPISPRLALLLAEVDEEPLYLSDGLTANQSSELNAKLHGACYSQVFGDSEESLRYLVKAIDDP